MNNVTFTNININTVKPMNEQFTAVAVAHTDCATDFPGMSE